MTTGPCKAAIASQRLEHPDIVVAQVAREVFVVLEHDSFLGESLLKRLEVERLAVGNHAIEIEDDRLERGGHAPDALPVGASAGAFSPARMAIFSRFDGGGYGHSHVGLYAHVGL